MKHCNSYSSVSESSQKHSGTTPRYSSMNSLVNNYRQLEIFSCPKQSWKLFRLHEPDYSEVNISDLISALKGAKNHKIVLESADTTPFWPLMQLSLFCALIVSLFLSKTFFSTFCFWNMIFMFSFYHARIPALLNIFKLESKRLVLRLSSGVGVGEWTNDY